jgi:hypothetical protein
LFWPRHHSRYPRHFYAIDSTTILSALVEVSEHYGSKENSKEANTEIQQEQYSD